MKSIMRRDVELIRTSREHLRVPPACGVTRILLLAAGSLALGLAVLAAILPVMPMTPFILLAVYCYARSSERCHTWLTTNRLFGRYVGVLTEGRRLTKRTKALLVASSGAMALISAVFIAPNLTARVLTLCVAAGMSTYFVLQGRRRRTQPVREDPFSRR